MVLDRPQRHPRYTQTTWQLLDNHQPRHASPIFCGYHPTRREGLLAVW